jgi:hypothetical protein
MTSTRVVIIFALRVATSVTAVCAVGIIVSPHADGMTTLPPVVFGVIAGVYWAASDLLLKESK